jgi:transketolase
MVIHFRSIPDLAFWHPADGKETSAAYLVALRSAETPSIISLSRQNLPNIENSSIELAVKGGCVLHEEEAEHLTIVSTGSEVGIALGVASKLRAQGIRARIAPLPCWLVFDEQPQEYRLRVLRSGAPILSLEALSVRDRFSVSRVGRLPDGEVTDRWLGEIQPRTGWFAGLGFIWSQYIGV